MAGADCRLVILGTAPSAESLRAGYYYAHPRNAFWRVLADTFDAPVPQTVGEKENLLFKNCLALWDVLCACARRGSLDSAIRDPQVNDFAAFFAAHPGITRVLFNGAAAEKLFFRFCGETLQGRAAARLPSTSPPIRSHTRKNWRYGERNFCDDEHTAQRDPAQKALWRRTQ